MSYLNLTAAETVKFYSDNNDLTDLEKQLLLVLENELDRNEEHDTKYSKLLNTLDSSNDEIEDLNCEINELKDTIAELEEDLDSFIEHKKLILKHSSIIRKVIDDLILVIHNNSYINKLNNSAYLLDQYLISINEFDEKTISDK